jgi:antitoxin component YwqK of YwqJK toxin-antitoxin module
MENLAELIEKSDVSFFDENHRPETLITYVNTSSGDSLEILKDSSGKIIFAGHRRNGKCISSGEYYSNGQLKGKYKCDRGEGEVSDAIYYYEDGRVKSEGTWLGNNMVGIWRNYDAQGYLISVEHYSKEGLLEKKENVAIVNKRMY